MRDFFWDDDFRPKWDAMLAYCKVLEECPQNGTMISHWIKKVFGPNVLETIVFLSVQWYGLLISHLLFLYSSLFSAVIENISLLEEYGRLETHTIVSQR